MSFDLARKNGPLFLLLLGTALLAFWRLGGLPLFDVDEPVYGEVGREMAAGGPAAWLTPHYNGRPWFDKPPLFYWLVALAMRGLGVNEFAARLPSALLAVLLVAATYWLARRAYPDAPSTGLWAGFVLATCLQFFLLARASVTDMALTAALTGALLAVYGWVVSGRGRWMALAGLLTGLAALTKGPVALLLIGLQVLLYVCLVRQGRRLLAPALWGGLALCLLAALPWYVAMIHLHGPAFVTGFLEANNLTRFLKPEHPETRSPLFFVPVFLAGFFPWSVALPGAVRAGWKRIRGERREPGGGAPALFLCLWCAVVFVFFSASQSKLVTYIFPMYPAAAVLVGRWLARRSEAAGHRRALIAYAALAVGLGIGLWLFGPRYGIAPVTVGLWLLVLALGAALAVGLRPPPLRRLIPGLATGLFLLITWASPTWKTRGAEVSERDAARAASAAVPPQATLHVLCLQHPSLLFYARRPVTFEEDLGVAAAQLHEHAGDVYAMPTKKWNELRMQYPVRNVRTIYQNPHTVVVQSGPPAPDGRPDIIRPGNTMKLGNNEHKQRNGKPSGGSGETAQPLVRLSDVQ